MGLCKHIENELIRKGHEVLFVEDKPLKFNYRFSHRHNIKIGFLNKIFKLLSKIFVDYNAYWDEKLNSIGDLKFDFLFVVNGFSYDKHLLERLREYNRNIKTRLYLWDNLNAYDFSYIVNDVDACYTLDFLDSRNVEKMQFLPAFWVDDKTIEKQEKRYDVFLIGTNHDDRYFIAKKVIEQLDKYGFTYLIKLIDKYKKEDSIITHKFYPTKEYLELMMSSQCILDTERQTQTGPTVRLIWSLALGKKIISTNVYMKEMPFFNPEQILIIDRKNPVINEDFIRQEKVFLPSEYINSLRIDNWVNIVLK